MPKPTIISVSLVCSSATQILPSTSFKLLFTCDRKTPAFKPIWVSRTSRRQILTRRLRNFHRHPIKHPRIPHPITLFGFPQTPSPHSPHPPPPPPPPPNPPHPPPPPPPPPLPP